MSRISDHFLVQKTSRDDEEKKTKKIRKKKRETADTDICEAGPSGTVTISDDEILKQFDLDWRYGPCTGLTRLERWERAEKHGLEPPQNVHDLISQHATEDKYMQSVWSQYEGLK